MTREPRRQFLKRTGTGLAGIAMTPALSQFANASTPRRQPYPASWLPRAMTVPGIHGYSEEKSVAAGQTIAFRVSGTVPYRMTICRLGPEVDDPKADTVLHEFDPSPAYAQAIHPGSYVCAERALPPALRGLTLACWVRPWKLGAWSGLITQHDYPRHCGCGLFLNPQGGLHAYLGDGGAYQSAFAHATQPGLLSANAWHHVVLVWDGSQASVWVNGQLAETWAAALDTKPLRLGDAPLRLAAYGEQGRATHLLDGDLAMPTIHAKPLEPFDIQLAFADQALTPAQGDAVLACWPLHEERGDRLEDVSGQGRHGRIVNQATWMIGGPSFQADVARFDTYDPGQDARRGHGLRFASDDLYDCRWRVTHRWRVPSDARSGLYAARIHFDLEGTPRLYHMTFLVRKPKRRKKAPLLVLCAANTWLAYNGTPFGVNAEPLHQVWGTGGTDNSPGDPPAFNLYRAHAGGQGTYQVGMRMPWPAAGPYILYGGPTRYSHLMRAERFAHAWLEAAGYAFDVISDLDLHRDPDQLRDYQALLINGHSEYWSIPMYQGLRRYLARGGNAIVLSGNSLFWRVSFNDDLTLMECRKVDAPGNQLPAQKRGECWHSQDGLRGGMLRECGFPGWHLIGLETLGWNNQGNPAQFGPYVVDAPDHFLFHQPFPVGAAAGEPIGQGPDGALPRANGHEIDVRLSTLNALQTEPNPAGAEIPSDPPGMVRLANGIIPWKIGGAAFDYFFRPIKPATDQGGEMIYWERAEGGRVFNAGSIGAGWALHADPRFQALLKNVLAHFGVAPPR